MIRVRHIAFQLPNFLSYHEQWLGGARPQRSASGDFPPLATIEYAYPDGIDGRAKDQAKQRVSHVICEGSGERWAQGGRKGIAHTVQNSYE